jgi:hypothetical protein
VLDQHILTWKDFLLLEVQHWSAQRFKMCGLCLAGSPIAYTVRVDYEHEHRDAEHEHEKEPEQIDADDRLDGPFLTCVESTPLPR